MRLSQPANTCRPSSLKSLHFELAEKPSRIWDDKMVGFGFICPSKNRFCVLRNLNAMIEAFNWKQDGEGTWRHSYSWQNSSEEKKDDRFTFSPVAPMLRCRNGNFIQ